MKRTALLFDLIAKMIDLLLSVHSQKGGSLTDLGHVEEGRTLLKDHRDSIQNRRLTLSLSCHPLQQQFFSREALVSTVIPTLSHVCRILMPSHACEESIP